MNYIYQLAKRIILSDSPNIDINELSLLLMSFVASEKINSEEYQELHSMIEDKTKTEDVVAE